jgi:hypothetical protein
MSKRMLHENITTSDKFSKVGFEAECLYNRLLTQTDDYGNVRGSIGYIKDVCFPKNKLNKKIDYQMVGKWLSECLQIGLLCGYQVDGIEYLHFNRFEDFQTLRKDRIKNSSIPMFTPMQPSGNQVDNQVVTKCQHELEVEVKEEVEVKYSNKFTPPTKEQIKEYAISRNRLDLVDKFFDYYSEGDWKDKDGKKVKNWKQKFITWENRNQQQTQNKPKTFEELKVLVKEDKTNGWTKEDWKYYNQLKDENIRGSK